MYGSVYVVNIAAGAVTVAADLVELTVPDDKILAIHGFEILQTTDLGDAAEEIIGVTWIRGHTTSGSGGSAPTPVPVRPGSAAATFTAETLNTTAASTGTPVNLHKHGWNIRIPLSVIYTPETRPMITQAQSLMVLRMDAAPLDSITISGHVLVEEIR